MSEESTEKKEGQTSLNWVELEQKLQEHREQRKKWILVVVLVCAVIAALIFVYFRFAEFHNYRTSISIERTDSDNINYASFQNMIIRYGNEGASCIAADNSTVWTESWEMENPVICVRNNFVAVADQKGKLVYVLDRNGFCQKIETDLPIQKVDVSDAGNVAVLMQEESNISYLSLYSINGKKTAEGTLHFSSSGYPMALALSEDGENLALSVLDIKEGVSRTSINFYNFSKMAEEGKDNQVASFSYEGTVVPGISYGTGGRLVAFGDNKVICFTGGKIPQEANVVELENKVKSIVYDSSQFGLLYEQGEEAGGNTLVLYDFTGDEKRRFAIEGQYSSAGFLGNGEIYLVQERKLAIYRRGGRAKFAGTADTPFYTVLSEGHGTRYVFVREGKMEQVRLSLFQ